MSSENIGAIVAFSTKVVTAQIARPSNTTDYASGDVIANITTNELLTFENAVKGLSQKLSGSISTARVHSSANVGTKPDLELWLFHTKPALDVDNAVFTPTDEEMKTVIGVIDFPTGSWRVGTATAGAGGNSMCETKNIGLAFRAAGQDIYGALVHRAAYTPVSDEVFTVDLVITQD